MSETELLVDDQINNAIKNRAFKSQRDKYSLPSFNEKPWTNQDNAIHGLFPYCRKIYEFTKTTKCNPSQPLEVLVLAKKILSRNSAVSASYFL